MIVAIGLCILIVLAYAAWEVHIARRNARQRKRHFADVAWRMYRR